MDLLAGYSSDAAGSSTTTTTTSQDASSQGGSINHHAGEGAITNGQQRLVGCKRSSPTGDGDSSVRCHADDHHTGALAPSPRPVPASLLPSAADLLVAEGPGPAGLPEAPIVLPRGPKRVRGFPHIEGNFATHVYFEVSVPSDQRRRLSAALARLQAQAPAPWLQPITYADDGSSSGSAPQGPEAVAPSNATERGPGGSGSGGGGGASFPVLGSYHVSLSRVVPIRRHQIEPLRGALRKEFEEKGEEGVGARLPFGVSVGGFQVFVNDARSRTFLALGVSCSPTDNDDGASNGTATAAAAKASTSADSANGHHAIVDAIRRVDAVFARFGLQRFHARPRPHISVAWALGDKEAALARAIGNSGSGGGGGSSKNGSSRGGGDGGGSGYGDDGERALPAVSWAGRVARVLVRIGKKVDCVWQAGA